MNVLKKNIGQNLIDELNLYFDSFLDLVFPVFCVDCKTKLKISDSFVCSNCFTKIRLLTKKKCRKCSHEIGNFSTTDICNSCHSKRFYFKNCVALIEYNDIARTIFHEIKFKKRRNLLMIFDKVMQSKIDAITHIAQDSTIIPVPMRLGHKRKRTFNQAEIIAKKIAKITKQNFMELLIKNKSTKQQSLLTQKDRLKNLCGSFAVKKNKNIKGKRILIIDDVITTGSTLNECAKELMNAGAREVNCITIARSILN